MKPSHIKMYKQQVGRVDTLGINDCGVYIKINM